MRGETLWIRAILEGAAFAILLSGVAVLVWWAVPAGRPWEVRRSGEEGRFRALDSVRGAVLYIQGAPTRGAQDAKIVVIEFSDYQCPFCGTFARETEPEIFQRHVEGGRVLWVFKNLPLATIHAFAIIAAQAADCASLQDRFWPMHDMLFADPGDLGRSAILRRAVAIDMEIERFRECLDGPASARVREDIAEARRIGVQGTPTLLIATRLSGGTVRVLRGVSGSGSTREFDKIFAETIPRELR
jgi:protein-disulfide isomerase